MTRGGGAGGRDAPEAPEYLATVLPGLEPVASSEITAKVEDAAIQETPRGKVLFVSGAPLERLLALRSVDNLYRLLGRVRAGPHRADLPAMSNRIAALDVGPAGRATFFVNASRSGRHSYSRFDLAEAAARGILARRPRWRLGTAERHEVEFRLDVAGEEGLFSLRLTPPSFRFRGEERAFSPAALRPTVAHALVWLSAPAAGDCFVDPFCGSGSILAERAAYPARRLLGGDRSAEAVAAARRNVPPDPARAILVWDARRLPLDAGAVDKVVANLPFGRQVLGPDEIGELYGAFAGEVRRVLAPRGQAILLTDQVEALLAAAGGARLQAESLLSLSLKGLHPQVIRLARASA